MKKFVLLLVFVGVMSGAVFGDSWAVPGERDFHSENGLFVIHTLPSVVKGQSARITVSQINNDQKRNLLWECELGFEGSPRRCYTTDDGKNVISVDQVDGRKHGGYGDHILAFYNKNGIIKNYLLAEILGLPKETEMKKLHMSIYSSISGIRWSRESIEFLDNFDGVEYFCMWLGIIEKWLAWEVTTGKSVKVSEQMQSKWIEKARNKVLRNTKNGANASVYLGYLRRAVDRKLIEKALETEEYYPGGGRRKTHDKKLIVHSSGSWKRRQIEEMLAAWDLGADVYSVLGIKMRAMDRKSRISEIKSRVEIKLPYLLGSVEGVVELPELENPREAVLWIYLVGEKDKFTSCDDPPAHMLAASFRGYPLSKLDIDFARKFPFRFQDVTPGRYRVEVVLDRTDPPKHTHSTKCYFKQPGDYTNTTEPLVEVQKGNAVKGVSISCTSLVE